jgi:Sulfotransferase family
VGETHDRQRRGILHSPARSHHAASDPSPPDGLCSLGLLLDELFFRNYRKVSMIQPLFIIGFPRSGTTFLQKLLSLDEEKFASITLGQSLMPSLTSRKIVEALAAVDRAIGGLGAKLVTRFETWWRRGLEDIHPWAFNEPEEDILLAVHSFTTSFVYLCVSFIASRVKTVFRRCLSGARRSHRSIVQHRR